MNKFTTITLFTFFTGLVFFISFLSHSYSVNEPLDPTKFGLPSTAKEVTDKRTLSTVTFELSPGHFVATSRDQRADGQGECKSSIPFFCNIVAGIASLVSPAVNATTAGPSSPTTNSEDTSNGGLISITNRNNAHASDDVYTGVSSNGTPTTYGVWTGFGFSIPSGATIDGILFEIEANRTGPAGVITGVRPVKGGTVGGNNSGSITLSATDTYYSVGGATDLQGLTWTDSDINASNFGVAVTVNQLAMGGARIDHIRTTIYYTAVTTVSVSGTVYTNESGTTMGSGRTVAISIAGAAAAGTNDTASDGTFSITGLTISAGNVLTLYLDGETEKAVTVTVGTGSNMTGINLYQNDLATRCDNSCSLSNTNLDTADGNGDTDISAIYTVSGGALTVAAGKSLYIPASNTFAPGGNVSVGGNFTNAGTYTKGTETLTLTGTSTQNLTTNGSQLYAVTLNGSGSVYTPGDAVTVSNNLTITAGTLSLAGNAFTVSGTTSISGTISTATSATGTKTFTGAVTVASGGTLDMSNQNPVVALGGGLVQSSSNLANIGSGANTLVGNLSGSGTGGITFGGGLTISSGTTSNSYTGGTVTVTGTLTLTGNWAQANGSALSLGSTTPFSGAGTFSASTATNTVSYTASGTQTVKDPDAGTSHAYSNLSLSGTSAKTMTGITTANNFSIAGSASTSGNVMTTISGTLTLSGTAQMTTGANLTVTGVTTIGDGTTLTLGAFSFTNTGNVVLGGGTSGTFTATSGSAINLVGNLTINSGATFTKMTSGNFTFKSGTGSQTVTDSTAALQNLGDVKISSNTTNTTLTLVSNIKATTMTIDSSQTLSLSSFTMSLTGTSTPFVPTGTFTPSTGTVAYTPASSSTITVASTTYHHVTFNSSSTTFNLGGALTTDTDGNLTITAGTLDTTLANSYGISVGGTWSNSGTFTPRSGTVTLTGTSTFSDTTSFYDFTINGSGKTVTLGAALTATHTLTLTQGTLNASASAVNAGTFNSSNTNTRVITMGSGTWTLSGTGTVWDVSTATGLTLTGGTSTIVISDTSSSSKTFAGGGQTYGSLSATASGSGAVIIQGSNTFTDFTINAPKTITFTASTTQTISGTLSCTGTSGNVITINSSSGGSAGILSKASGTVSCDYLSLSDSTATGGATFNAGSNSTNGGGNSGWSFGGLAGGGGGGGGSGSNPVPTPTPTPSVIAFEQKHFKIYQDNGGLNSADPYAVEDTNANLTTGVPFRVRFSIANTGTVSGSITRRIEFKEDSGSWTQITANTNNIRLSASSMFADADATTSRLTGTGTFTPGQGKDTGSETTQISLSNSYYLEDEFSLVLTSGASGHSYQLRITNGGTPLDVYNATPSINGTVGVPPVPSNFNPVSGMTLATNMPTIYYSLDKAGDCKASTVNASYDLMSGADCTGDGSTGGRCYMPNLGSNGSKTIYLACQDTSGNKDTSSTTHSVTYVVSVGSYSSISVKGSVKVKGTIIFR